MPVTTEKVLVTPALAEEWLKFNHSNRNQRTNVSAKYARDMSKGNWRDIGGTISFERPDPIGDEFLLDGQNRLQAIITSGTSQWFTVIRGLDRDDQAVMDSGAARSVADALTMTGWSGANRLASAARLVLLINNGAKRWAARESASNVEILEFIREDADLVKAVHEVDKIWLQVKIMPANAAASYYLGMHRHAEETDVFFQKLRTGVALDQGDPILALRQRLNVEALSQTRNQQLWTVLRSMNHTFRGITATRMQLPRGSKVGPVEIIREAYEITRDPQAGEDGGSGRA